MPPKKELENLPKKVNYMVLYVDLRTGECFEEEMTRISLESIKKTKTISGFVL